MKKKEENMNEQKETSLVVKNDSFFDRLKEFFKLFFSYFSINEEDNLKNDTKENDNNIVNNNIKNINDISEDNFTEEDYEKKLQEILLELQEAYESGIIKEEELNPEQKEDLKRLYILQINYLKDSIEKNESVILKLKEKIDIINNNK